MMKDRRKQMKVSVVMSVYNGKEYLALSVNSVLSQTYHDFQFIIIDDCSTDGSSEILASMAQMDTRIILLKNERNIGLTKSLNLGIEAANGDYIARMDADDICMPERLASQLAYMNENSEVDLVYADTLLIDKNTEIICQSWRPSTVQKVLNCLEKHNFIPHPTVMFKKSIFDQLGGYDEQCLTGQDVNLWLRMREGKCKIGYLNKVVLMYRLNPSSVRAYLSDYWFSIGNICVWNGSKLSAFRYFSHLTFKQKLILVVKIAIPFSYFVRKFK